MVPSLAEALLSTTLTQAAIGERVDRIHGALLAASRFVREPNFKSIHPDDLAFLFRAYDREFFEGKFDSALNGYGLHFRLSPRMAKAGGSTSCRRNRLTGERSFEIAIATSLLYDGFGGSDRGVTACGLACPTRLHALQRILEHELVHLGEQLCWESSNCGAPRFQGIAARHFLHTAHTHDLITRRERAAASGIRVGAMVSFNCEGRRLTGRVNRVTKRASVLVPDPAGTLFSDGGRYVTYYVPIRSLVLALESAPGDA